MNLKTFILILVIIIVGVTAIYLLVNRPACIFGPKKIASSFDECVAAGYPILESYPRQCKTPDGKTFVEDISK